MGAEQIIQSSAALQNFAAFPNYAAFSDILQIEVLVPAMILLVATVLMEQVFRNPEFTKVLYHEILEVVDSRDKLVAKAKAMLTLLANAAEVCFPALTFVRNSLGRLRGSKCGEKKETSQEEKSAICQRERNMDFDVVAHCSGLLSDSGISTTADVEDDSDVYSESDASGLSPPQSPAPTLSSESEKEEDEIQIPRGAVKRGERVLLNPLAIKFSQDRVRPNFQDGREVDDASALVTPVPFAEARATQEGGEAAVQQEEEGNQGEAYDEFLAHPFPTIEVIRWRAKARAADGSWVKDPETGKDVMGEEQWFTLDNRRLCAVQKAAAKCWPKRCCVVVRVLRGDFGHALKKFKTSSNGRTVEVGNRFWGDERNTNSIWSWEATVEAAPKLVSPAEEEAALAAIQRDERRPDDLACLKAKGCARLLELPQYKGQEVTLAELKLQQLPASTTTTAKKTESSSRRFEYWLASKEGTRVAKKPAAKAAPKEVAAAAVTKKTANTCATASPAVPSSPKKMDNLIALMRKAASAEEDSEASTRASSADEAATGKQQAKRAAAPAASKAEEKRSEKRRQRGRQQQAVGVAATKA